METRTDVLNADQISVGLATALTFDDVLLVPQHSTVLPSEVDVSSNFTRNIRLHVPIASAAMDTVTESRLAIAMAQQGGIGIIHKNLAIEEQASEVDRVKRSESGMIVNPITLSPTNRIFEALELMKKYRISGVPITQDGSKEGRLVGILTNRDLRFENNVDRPISDIMTREPLFTVPVGTTLDAARDILHRHKVEKLLVVDDQYRLKGLITVKDIQKAIKYPNACKDSLGRLRVGAAIGTGKDAVAARRGAGRRQRRRPGHRHRARPFAGRARHGPPHPAAVREGRHHRRQRRDRRGDRSADRSRRRRGQGRDRGRLDLHDAGGGGHRGADDHGRSRSAPAPPRRTRSRSSPTAASATPATSPRRSPSGASAVMIGSLFAGTDESPGELILFQGRSFKEYRGMGSLGAMRRGSRDRYFQDEFDLDANPDAGEKLVPEGIEGRVAHKGSVAAMIHQLMGGLRAGMGYTGCKNVPTLQREAKMIRVSPAGLREGHVHDVIITKEAPNYRVE